MASTVASDPLQADHAETNEVEDEEVLEATDGAIDDDALFEELEKGEDLDMAHLREQRMEELKAEMSRIREMKENLHGTYLEIGTEKELMKITTSTKLCVVHFFHKEFRRCQIMDSHLVKIARKHFKTRFVKIDVDNAPFLVDRLTIQILPCVIAFLDGVSVER